MTRDRDLLEALFAQQLGFASASDVMAAGAQWLVQRESGAGLCDVLTARGALDAQQARLVNALVSEVLEGAGGDTAKAWDSLPPNARDSLAGLAATLRADGGAPSASGSFDSLETPENVGTEAPGRYTFDTGRKGRTEELGRGGAGRVMVARDHFLGRDVALKELHRELTQDERSETLQVRNLEARFLREARVTGQLEHPAVVPVYELGRRRDGTLYYTMRRIRGRTLAQALADAPSREGRLSFVPDLLAACRGVAAAHHRDVVHRDLKPQNVMLGPHGETYVMDWGLARVMGRAERTHHSVQLAPDLTGGRDLGPVGTPSYMSPEQAVGNRDDLDARSDVWGLGAMLFEILTGRAPYVGRSAWDVLAEVRSRPPPAVHTLEPEAPPELAAICERALSWDRERRYAHAGALAADLEAFLTGRRVQAYDYTFRELASRLLRRHRALGLLAVVTLLAVVALGSAWAAGVRRERDEARAMARFFLADVSPALAEIPGSGALVEQLSGSALEAFSLDLDVRGGPRDDRLLLARAWNEVAHQHWSHGDGTRSRAALDQAERVVGPLVRQFPRDVEVLAAQLQTELWAIDLRIDAGEDIEALTQLEGLMGRAQALRAEASSSIAVVSVLDRILARVSHLRGVRGELQLSAEIGRRARDTAWAWYRLAPDEPLAAVAIMNDSVDLASVLMVTEQRAEALRTLRDADAFARTMRAQRDSRSLQTSHATVLHSLALALDPASESTERNAAIREGRRILVEVLSLDAGDNLEVSELVDLLLLEGEADEAWRWASRAELNAEFSEALVAAAFATGRDALIREEAAARSQSAPAAMYAGFVELLAGNPHLARTQFERCLELRCGMMVTWHPQVLLTRLKGRQGPGVEALRALATDNPVSLGSERGVTAALEELRKSLQVSP